MSQQNKKDPSKNLTESDQKRLEILQHFVKIFNAHFHSGNLPTLLEKYKKKNPHSTQNDYMYEAAILKSLNGHGLHYGFAAGIVSFVVLRKLPGVLTNYLLKRRRRQGGGLSSSSSISKSSYKFDNPKVYGTPPGATTPSHIAQQQQQQSINKKPAGLFMRTIRLAVDALLSVYVAAGVTAWKTDYSQMINTIANIPLVEGKSLLSEELCYDFIQEYDKHRDLFDPAAPADTQSSSLDMIMKSVQSFTVNCKKRKMYEKVIQEQRGGVGGDGDHDFLLTGSSSSISIPSPGVPPDLNVDDDDYNHFVVDAEEEERDSSSLDNKFQDGSFSKHGDGQQQMDEWESFDDFEKKNKTPRPPSPR